MARHHRFIQEGDLVVLYMSRDRTPITLTATKGATHVNAFGIYPHDSIIGMPFGSTLKSANERGFVTLLRPTPELWTQSLPHRTQILYGPDMSFIALKLALTPGSKVIEAGTGSASFTHFLARCVARNPQGVTVGKGWKGSPGVGVNTKGAKGRNCDLAPFARSLPERNDAPSSSSSTPRKLSPAPAPAPALAVDAPSSRQTSPPFRGSPPPAHVANTEAYAAERNQKVARAQAEASFTTDDLDTSGGPEDGRVWSFEFHAERKRRAQEELELHGLCPRIVSLSLRNVCLNGFPSSLEGQADAVFLDLPAPWEAIPFLPSVLDPKVTTRVCCFSPCIEQVLRTVKALSNCGFRDVEMYEVLIRSHESIKEGVADMPSRDIGDVQARLREVAEKRERVSEGQRRRAQEKRQLQLAKKSEEPVRQAHASLSNKADRGRAGDEEVNVDEQKAEGVKAPDDEGIKKKPRLENSDGAQGYDNIGAENGRHDRDEEDTQPRLQFDAKNGRENGPPNVRLARNGYGNVIVRSNLYSRAHPTMRGHTSYLTFANLLPRSTAGISLASGPTQKLTGEANTNSEE